VTTALEPGLPTFVPWRPDGGERDRLWSFCRAWWDGAGLDIREGSSPPGPFQRAAAINEAASGPWDVAVVIDADVVAPHEQVHAAADAARRTGRVTLGFDMYVGLSPAFTPRVLAGETADWDRNAIRRSKVHESSIVAVPRPLWDLIGGFDERFVGWGQEDVAFIQSARVLGGGIDRVGGTVYHLWHRPSRERDWRLGTWRPNQELGIRYREARDRDAIEALLGER
jgi:hypothetical protein